MAEVTVSRRMLAGVLVLVLLGAIPPKRSDIARENGL
jgi:hypothetical protein